LCLLLAVTADTEVTFGIWQGSANTQPTELAGKAAAAAIAQTPRVWTHLNTRVCIMLVNGQSPLQTQVAAWSTTAYVCDAAGKCVVALTA
jgi:hypothetical protein